MDLKVAPLTVLLQTVNKLRDAILRGHFKPGHRLVESELCRQVGVSRTSIREALRRLEAEKLITIIPNKGPSVTVITWPEAQQIYQVRGLLEGEAAALFAPRATSADITQMREALADFSKSVADDDLIGRLESTMRFYQIIIAGCGNSIIREILEGLLARINFLRARSMSRPGRGKDSMREMQRMLNAIVKKDAAAARATTVEHVEAACEAAREVFESEIEQQIA